MTGSEDDRFLMAACRDPRAPGGWVFYFVNNGQEPIAQLAIKCAGVEWGDQGWIDVRDREIGPVGGRQAIEVWSCDSDAAEFNPWLTLLVRLQGADAQQLMFEFPKLYKIRRLARVPLLDVEGFLCHPTRG